MSALSKDSLHVQIWIGSTEIAPESLPFLVAHVLQTWLASVAVVLQTPPCGSSPWRHDDVEQFPPRLERLCG
eukprot:6095270-Prorocentrum_lima.AAC.1